MKTRKKQLGVTDDDIAAALGVERSVANKVVNGKVELNARRADDLAKLLQVPRDELLFRAGITSVRPDGAQPVRDVPLLGTVPGGNWREAVRRSSNTVPVPASEAPRDSYALTVEGDSMDKHVPDGFTIVVDPADLDLFPGRLYIVMNEDGETTFKEYQEGPARLAPASNNPNHREIPISGGGFRILGRVVWSGKRHV